MARYFSAARTESLTLEAARARNLTWDVFVSHTTRDDALAEEVAKCIRSLGLTAWVDSDNLPANHDGPGIALKIQGAISRSYCLLAIVTNATNASWWVPFEIGVAWDMRKYLSTYGDPQVTLPSFLAVWPQVKDRQGLRSWCEAINSKKATYQPIVRRAFVEVASEQRSSYARDMRDMARRFPGRR